MALTPMDIHNQEFNTKMRGYDRNEVDSFLDSVVDSFSDALDKNIDLRNENTNLKMKINDLSEKLAKYDEHKESLNRSLILAQENAEKVEKDAQQKAKEILANAGKEAAAKTKELQNEYNILDNDYELLKEKVASFRVEIQKVLKDQLKQLDDNTWQYYLDQYYGRERLYPADGKQPISSEVKKDTKKVPGDSKVNTNSQTNIDNSLPNEVNSGQGSNKEELKPSIEEGPSQEENVSATEEPKDKGPMIVFPDDYKEHK